MKYIPFLCAVVASFFFASSTFLTKLIGAGIISEPVHPLQITHARFTFGFLLTFFFHLICSQRKLSKPNFQMHFLRATAGYVGVAIMFYGVIHLPITDAVSLIFVNPIFAMIFAIFILGERVDRYRWLAAFIALFGAVILLRPSGFQINLISLLCLIGAASFGLEITLIKFLTKKEHPLQILIFSNAIGILIATVPLFYVGNLPNIYQWIILFGIGYLMLMGQLLFLFAMQRSDASVIAPVIYFTVVFVTVMDIIFLKAYPDIWSYCGASLILLSALFVAFIKNPNPRRSMMKNDRSEISDNSAL